MSDRARAGGTVVGVATEDGVAVVSSREAGDGSIRAGTARRLSRIHPRGVAGGVGPVGAVATVLRDLRAAVDRHDLDRGSPPGFDALATMARDRLREGPTTDVGLLVAGADDDRGHLFEGDADGGVTGDDRIAIGAGREVAAGVLEAGDEPADLDAAMGLAARGLAATMARLGGVGEGVTVARIAADGVSVEDLASVDDLP